ncbi:hypothetical protein [Ruixingdingia sedimenti]|uniref:Uncharacterized protein n=1 Tax=Ruixingdingia sedimenti TaxID=3073604 RepID=A0ABU1F7L4_9RHOB|nr:hypothetical protein [Xinfangfangia sp. LG-4]MDR5652852.1 hypothetical protein [Xinfangfangia sp. LG-4]
MNLLGLLGGILFVGQGLFGPGLPAMVEQALRQRGIEIAVTDPAPDMPLTVAAEAVAAQIAADPPAALVILPEDPQAPGTAEAIARLAAAAAGARVLVVEGWPPLSAGADWRGRIAADLPAWQALAHAAAHPGEPVPELVPAAQALVQLADRGAGALDLPWGLYGPEGLANDRGRTLAAYAVFASLSGQSPEGLPPRLLRRWAARDGAVDVAMARAMQAAVQAAQAAHVLPAPPAPPPAAAADAATPVAVAAAAEPAVPAPALPGVLNPNLAFGLNGVADWTPQLPFLDLFKTARPWTGHLHGRWGGWGHAELAAGGWLDDNGWPRAIPPEVSALEAFILTDLPPDTADAAGRYRLTYAGQGRLSVGGRAQTVRSGPGEIWFDATPGEGVVAIRLEATDPADPIRDIRVVREDRIALYEAGRIFNPRWLERIRGVRLVRFMDWMGTNNAPHATLADLPRPDDYTWGWRGVPMETMVALANELHADAWFTVPHLADDALARRMAELAHAGLDPDLRAWVEYSNEVWNWQFGQTRWADQQARARWGREHAWLQFYALRAMEVATIWAEVFGRAAPDRLVRVITTHTGWLGLEQDMLHAPLWVAENPGVNRLPADGFDAYAVTGYFGGALGGDEKAPMVRRWLAASRAAAESAADGQGLTGAARDAWVEAHRFDTAVALAAAELRDGAESGDPGDSIVRLVAEVWPYHARVAAEHGLQLVMYEGGTHVVGLGAQVDDAELGAFFAHLNYTPEMGALYTQLLEGWRAVTDAPFNAFVDVSQASKWGSWGHMRHLADSSPRWTALTGPQ